MVKKHLIYKEDLLETILSHFGIDLAYFGEDLQFCQEAVQFAPTVDVVEVVRCKDCKHLEITGCYGECGRAYLSGIVKPWDFCSYGERKDNGC